MTRADLAPGTQTCQAIHAAFDFSVTFPDLTARWHSASNTIVVLAVRDELALSWLCADADTAGLRIVRVHEPDLDGALTAVAIEPAGAGLVRGVRLALAGQQAGVTFSAGEEVRT